MQSDWLNLAVAGELGKLQVMSVLVTSQSGPGDCNCLVIGG